jgi:hypothetical protein
VLSSILGKKLWKLMFQHFNLWAVANLNVGIVSVAERIILVLVLGTVEAFQRYEKPGVM